MTKPTQFESELGKKIREKFGQNTKVVRFADDSEEHFVFIVSGNDFPVRGVTSYGSVGLYKNAQHIGSEGVFVEILGACATETPHVDNLLASCVFDSVKNRSNIVYGSCIKGILSQYNISRSLQHVTFVSPFLWEGLEKLVVDNVPVHCLMMLPISEAEANYLEANGIDALERHFSEAQIDVFNINRPSVV
jgi:antitoxin YqcF